MRFIRGVIIASEKQNKTKTHTRTQKEPFLIPIIKEHFCKQYFLSPIKRDGIEV